MTPGDIANSGKVQMRLVSEQNLRARNANRLNSAIGELLIR